MKYYNHYRPKLGESWILMVAIVMILGNLIALSILGISGLIFPDVDFSVGWPLLLTYLIPFAVAWLYTHLRAKHQYNLSVQLNRKPYPNPKRQYGKLPLVLTVVLLVILCILLGIAAEPLYSWIPMPDSIKKIFEQLGNSDLPTFVMVVIAAPVCEEWLVRGVALKGMLQHSKKAWTAILWSAVMFGVLHANPWQAVPAIILGYAFGWVYARTRALWLCMFMHAVNNGFSFLLTALLPNIDAEVGWADLIPEPFYWFFVTGAFILCVLILYLLNRNFDPLPSLQEDSEQS